MRRGRCAAVLALVLLAGISGCGGDGGIEDLEDAQAVLGEDDAFASGKEAGVTFAKVADGLLPLGRRCVETRGREDERCQRLLAAAAFAEVFAVEALDCTQPGIEEARAGLARYLRDGGTTPRVPDCN